MLTTKIKIYFRYLDVSNRSVNTYLVDTMGVIFNTKARFDDPVSPRMVFYIRDNIDSQIKCVPTGDHDYAFRNGLENMRDRGQVIVVLKMWRVWNFGPPDIWLETEVGLSDFSSIRFCRRLRSSGNLCSTVTLMFRDMGL
ncbi:hypothetical protein Bca101_021651 [Brassica carinata]